MQNMKSIINNHNMKFLNNTAEKKKTVTAETRTNCPVNGKGLAPNIIYKARITSNQPT